MISESKSAPVETRPGASNRIQELKNELAPRWGEFWSAAVDAAGAELAIAALKALRLMALACLSMTVVSALGALAVYGFILLDAGFNGALQGLALQPWLSPLLRGGLYFGLAIGVTAAAWGYLFGTGGEDMECGVDGGKETPRG